MFTCPAVLSGLEQGAKPHQADQICYHSTSRRLQKVIYTPIHVTLSQQQQSVGNKIIFKSDDSWESSFLPGTD